MIPDVVRRFAMSDLPFDLAFIHVDGSDAAIRRFYERQALNAESARVFFGRPGSRLGAGVGTGPAGGSYTVGRDARNVIHVRYLVVRRGEKSQSSYHGPRVDIKRV